MARTSKFTDQQKRAIVREAKQTSLEEAAKKHGVSVYTVRAWRDKTRTSKPSKSAARKAAVPIEVHDMVEEIALGRKLKELLADLGYVRR